MILITMAWRNIWRNKVRSLLIMLSVSVGMFSGLFALALYKGMLAGRINTVIGYETGNIQIHHPGFKADYEANLFIAQSKQLLQSIQTLPEFSATASRSVAQGMLSTTTGSSGVEIFGVDTSMERTVSRLDEKLVLGNVFTSSQGTGILVGKKLADKLKLRVGNKLVLTFVDSKSEIVSAAFRVTGIFQTQNTPLDERQVYVHRSTLNNLLSIQSEVHEQVVILKEQAATDQAKKILQNKFPELSVESWKDLSPETELMVNAVDVYGYIILGIILFALAFGIVNTMLMAVLERTKEIGILMALGMNKIRLFILFMLEAFFLTVAGTPVGILVAWMYTQHLNSVGIDWSKSGSALMNSFGFSAVVYPVFPSENLFPLLGLVSVTAVLSCLLPALKALRLHPADALRK